jgi:hypothetical protein
MEKRADAGQSKLYKAAYDFFYDKITLQKVKDIVHSQITHFCSNAAFYERTNSPDGWHWWKGLKYLLFEYEIALAKGHDLKIKWADVQRKDKKDTIEHILPQTPTNEYWQDNWTSEHIKTATHDLGNLVITLNNSSLGNKSFPDKKGTAGNGKCYANSSLFQERELATHSDWFYEDCVDRRNKLVDWIKARWAIEDYVGSTGVIEDDDE